VIYSTWAEKMAEGKEELEKEHSRQTEELT
jgi:hypothetical protein